MSYTQNNVVNLFKPSGPTSFDMVWSVRKILSIRRFKEDVKEVQQGYECGLSLENFQDIKQGDVVEPYILEEIKV